MFLFIFIILRIESTFHGDGEAGREKERGVWEMGIKIQIEMDSKWAMRWGWVLRWRWGE